MPRREPAWRAAAIHFRSDPCGDFFAVIEGGGGEGGGEGGFDVGVGEGGGGGRGWGGWEGGGEGGESRGGGPGMRDCFRLAEGGQGGGWGPRRSLISIGVGFVLCSLELRSGLFRVRPHGRLPPSSRRQSFPLRRKGNARIFPSVTPSGHRRTLERRS